MTLGSDRAYHRPEFDTGQPVIELDGEHDVFGDGSVLLIPTPGHTPGHQSARVQTSTDEVLLVGDSSARGHIALAWDSGGRVC